MVFTIGTGFAVPTVSGVDSAGLASLKVVPHALQKTASSEFLLPQAEHCRIVKT
jgi:hypothetical protein